MDYHPAMPLKKDLQSGTLVVLILGVLTGCCLLALFSCNASPTVPAASVDFTPCLFEAAADGISSGQDQSGPAPIKIVN